MQTTATPTHIQQQQQQQQCFRQAALQPPSQMHSTQNNYSSPAASMQYRTHRNYYEHIQPAGPQDTQIQIQHFDPNDKATQGAAMSTAPEGTSPMETGAQH
jgi:hypothetical protein